MLNCLLAIVAHLFAMRQKRTFKCSPSRREIGPMLRSHCARQLVVEINSLRSAWRQHTSSHCTRSTLSPLSLSSCRTCAYVHAGNALRGTCPGVATVSARDYNLRLTSWRLFIGHTQQYDCIAPCYNRCTVLYVVCVMSLCHPI